MFSYNYLSILTLIFNHIKNLYDNWDFWIVFTAGFTSSKSPLLVIDPLYTNYVEFANRLSIPISSVIRQRNKAGSYEKLDLNEIQNKIDKENPNGILIIPADNPPLLACSNASIMRSKDIPSIFRSN